MLQLLKQNISQHDHLEINLFNFSMGSSSFLSLEIWNLCKFLYFVCCFRCADSSLPQICSRIIHSRQFTPWTIHSHQIPSRTSSLPENSLPTSLLQRHFTPKTIPSQDNSLPRQFPPGTIPSWDNSLPRQFTPKTIHSRDNSLPRQFTPKTIHSRDNSLLRQFAPETIYSQDNSLPGWLIPNKFTPVNLLPYYLFLRHFTKALGNE